MVGLKLILQSFRRDRSLFTLWVLSLSMAVTGLLIVDVFRQSLTHTLQAKGQEILSADLSISVRRAWKPNELTAADSLAADQDRSLVTEMLAMVTHDRDSRLVSLRFIDDAYPLRGTLEVERDGRTAPARGSELKGDVWVAPDLLTLLHVKVGDVIGLGKVPVRIAGLIKKDPTQTFRFGQMAPRLFASRRLLESSGLVQFGSTYSQSFLFRLKADPGLKKRAEQLFTDPEAQVTVPTDLEQGTLRVLSRLLDFLGLTGLVTLCLGWIGVYYLGVRWLALEATTGGILRCLGFSSRELLYHLLAKLFILMAAGMLCGGLLAWLGAVALLPVFQASLPEGFVIVWSWSNTLLLLLVGPLFGILLMLPNLRALATEAPLRLVQGSADLSVRWGDLLFFSGALLALFFAMTLMQARSFKVTFIFLGALLGTLFLVAALGSFGLRLSRTVLRWSDNWRVHTAVSIWTRRRSVALLLITVSALAGLLSQLIPTLEKTLVGELQTPENLVRPALFLFDVQDEQITPLEQFLKVHQIEVSESAPFIRARILKVNGQEFERKQTGAYATREEETDARMRNRGINLSYRSSLSKFEKIVAGVPFAQLGHDLISVERGYADRLKLKVGDQMDFDVQGFPVGAKIGNLREVDWDSFEPNFFILFSDGVLNEAPKTWIMTVKSNTLLKPVEMQSLVSQSFPNVTSLNVQETLDNISGLFGKLSSGLKIASGLCLVLGLFVFLLILLFQLASMRKDRVQLKLLGVRPRDLLWLNLLTYGGLCAFGLTLGSFLSISVAWALSHYAFEAHLKIDWLRLWTVFGFSLGAALVGILVLEKRLSQDDRLQHILAD